MIQLALNDIRKLVPDVTFKKGVQHYNTGNVIDLKVNGYSIDAYVKSQETCHVTLAFHPASGLMMDGTCSCPTYTSTGNTCQHMVSVLLHVLYNKGTLNTEIYKPAYTYILDDFQNVSLSRYSLTAKTAVHLEITLEIYKNKPVSIDMRIGTDKLYVIKDFKQLWSAIETEKRLEFGRGFVFDPLIHRFSETDEQIIALLREYYETLIYLQSQIHEGPHNPFKQFVMLNMSNHIPLPDHYLERVLHALNDRTFYVKYRGTSYLTSLSDAALDIRFSTKQTHLNDDIVISLEDAPEFFALTRDCAYVFYDDAIYHLSEDEQKLFPLLLRHFSNYNRTLSVPANYKSAFLSTIFPLLSQLGNVAIDENIAQNLILEPCKPIMYFDHHKKTFKATLYFEYGAYKVGIYPPVLPALPAEFSLVRQSVIENQILQLLTNSHCVSDASGHYLTLPDEEMLYDFVLITLPELSKVADLFYSDDFKTLQIKRPGPLHAAIRLNGETDLLEFKFQVDDFNQDEIPALLQALQERKKYYRMKDGRFFDLASDATNEMTEMADLIGQMPIKLKSFAQDMVELPKFRALYVDQLLAESNHHQHRIDQSIKQLVSEIHHPSTTQYHIPESLDVILRNYQKQGYYWMKALGQYGFGGILADDMGLGKTIQAITLFMTMPAGAQALVVAPTSLVYNWHDEILKFAPDLKVCILHGDQKIRSQIFENLSDYQVILTSYGMLKRDLPFYEQVTFEYCLIDEAQHIKNPNSMNAKSVKQIQAKKRFALTGTPIENALTELWSIFDFILPGYLHSHHKFIQQFEKPIVKDQDQATLAHLNRMIKPFLLRRLKSDVLKELPPKIETKVTVELTEKQKKLYLAYLEKAKQEISGSLQEGEGSQKTFKILSVLTRLRQICCHPGMFLDPYTGGSGKMEILEEIVSDALDSGHRLLIFSQFTTQLHFIATLLDQMKVTYFYLDGSTKPENRRDDVHSFNAGQRDVFLISLKAGGTGLNLTGADMVIHFDPWWNPAAEDQATDRAYRIGQDKPVQVMRLITQGTIEEKIDQLQQRKKALIHSVIQPGETFIQHLSETELKALLDL